MRERCENPNFNQYKDYGGRGVTIDPRWLGARGFANFLADMGPRPSSAHSLDRVGNGLSYGPGRCRWATREEQQNNRRNTKWITAFGETLTQSQWARRTGLKPQVIGYRLARGATPEEAVTP
jgi:hypothetical protein